MTELTRRSLLAGAAVASATTALPHAAHAAAPAAGKQALRRAPREIGRAHV